MIAWGARSPARPTSRRLALVAGDVSHARPRSAQLALAPPIGACDPALMKAMLVLVGAIALAGCGVSLSPTPSPGYTTLATSPETVRLSTWPLADPEAFAEAACAGTTWTVRDSTVGACKEHIVQAVGDMAASHGILVICDYSDGTGMVIIGGHLNPPPSFDPVADAELNCSLGARPGTQYRVLRFVDLP